MSGLALGRIGARRLAVFGAFAGFLALPLIGLVTNPVVLALVLALNAFIDAQADVGMNAAGVGVEEAAGRSIMTRLHGLWSLGTVAGSGVSALTVLAGISLGAHLIALSAFGLALTVVVSRLVPEIPQRERTGSRSRAVVVGLVLAGAAVATVEGTPFDWSALLLVDAKDASAALGGAGVIVFTIGMLVGRMGGDWIVDRYRRLPTLFAGIGIALAAMLIVVLSVPIPMVLLGFAVWGLGISVALPILYKLAGTHPSFASGAGLAALTAGMRVASIVAPALIGFAAAATSLPVAVAVITAVAGAAALVVVRVTFGRSVGSGDSLPAPGAS